MKSNASRRDFIKKKVLGGILFTTGIPFLPLGELMPSGKMNPKISGAREDIDWSEIRNQFPLIEDHYYFNTAALGPSPEMVINEVCDKLKYMETIPDDGHWYLRAAHETIAKFLHADPDEIAIIRNATEGMNIVARSLPLKAGDEILLSRHEHIGGSAPWIALQKDIGVSIKLIDLDLTGKNNLRIIKDNITEKTKVVSFSHITCTTGLVLPAKEIVEFCRSKGIYSCVDGAQAAGMIPVDLADINPDFYACSGHKWLFGPKGTGILFINKSVIEKCTPVFVGSYSDKKFDLNSLTLEYRNTAQREEYGTRNAPLMLGLASAVDFISSIGIQNIMIRCRALADYFLEGLSHIPGVELLTPEDPEYSASIVTFRIKGRDNMQITKDLLQDEKHLQVRGLYENDINGMRVSFAIFNRIKEIDHLLATLKKMVSG